MQLEKAIKTRKSVKRFSDKKPNWRKIIRAIDLARFAPAAGNQFATKFILVQDSGKIEKLSNAAQQKFIDTAHYVVVAVTDDARLKRSYDKRGERYGRQQAGAAIQNFLLSLNEQGLATSWVGHFDDSQVKRILEIDGDDLVVEAMFPIGKETKALAQQEEKPTKELETMLFFDKWGNKLMKPQTRVSLSDA